MLTQIDADSLVAMPKRLEQSSQLKFPFRDEKQSWKALSSISRDHFLMDVNRNGIRLLKCTYQERYRLTEILVRVDVGVTSLHQNPDGELIRGPHVHLYREGYGDKWASLLPQDRFASSGDLVQTLRDFLEFCNVEAVPEIQLSLL